MFEILHFLAAAWVAVVMAGLVWFWLRDFDPSRWQEWVLSFLALLPVVLTLWRAGMEIMLMSSAWFGWLAG